VYRFYENQRIVQNVKITGNRHIGEVLRETGTQARYCGKQEHRGDISSEQGIHVCFIFNYKTEVALSARMFVIIVNWSGTASLHAEECHENGKSARQSGHYRTSETLRESRIKQNII
jgi:hypothetical protein